MLSDLVVVVASIVVCDKLLYSHVVKYHCWYTAEQAGEHAYFNALYTVAISFGLAKSIMLKN